MPGSIEHRVSVLEKEVARLEHKLGVSREQAWWKRIVGINQNDPAFDEAERLGREWRESFKPKDGDVAPL